MTHEPLLFEEHDDHAVLRLNRPEACNAIDADMVQALHEACQVLERHPRPALVAGSPGTFAAGADIRQLRARRRDDALRGINSSVFSRIQCLPMPVIALVDGIALGGGAELAYACDFRIGTPASRFGNPEPGLGIVAAAGALWRLKELIGEPLATEVLVAGRILDADEALACHLLNEVVKPSDLEEAGLRLVRRIAGQAPLAVRLSKALLHAPREAHPMIDDLAQAVLFETEEKEERMTAFLERRKDKS
jgi:enoyl-CoA hydratase